MRKRDEIQRENTCLSHAHPEEMVFVLLGRDAAAADTIRYWCGLRILLGKNTEADPQIVEARQCARTMDEEGRMWTERAEELVSALASAGGDPLARWRADARERVASVLDARAGFAVKYLDDDQRTSLLDQIVNAVMKGRGGN